MPYEPTNQSKISIVTLVGSSPKFVWQFFSFAATYPLFMRKHPGKVREGLY